MPVIVINPFCSDKIGLSKVGVIIFFPISPEVMVVFYDGKIYDNKKYMVVTDEQEVLNLNRYQVISAEERIISRDKEELCIYPSDNELINIRKENISKKKIDSGFDGNETFVATKSRNIFFDFDLSFSKLPKYLKKIPPDCRLVYKRKFNYEARISLLVRVYRLPSLIRENPSLNKVDISKLKNGYSKMQRFMDDYWNLSKEDRIITPDLMKKLQTVPITYYPVNVE